MLRFVRFKSISSVKNQLVAGEVPITKSLIQKSIKDEEFHELRSVLNKNSHLLTDSIKSDLASFISQEFSIYYLLKDHTFTNDQLASLIQNNPERVDSSWDLYLRHNNGHDQNVSIELIKKLLKEPMESDWAKALYLYNELGDKSTVEEVIFTRIVESEDDKDVSKLGYFSFSTQFLLSKIPHLEGLPLVISLSKVLGSDVEYEVYVKAIDTFKKPVEDPEFERHYKNISKKDLEFDTITLDTLFNHIEKSELDVSTKPESLLLRLKVMHYLGMDKKNFEQLLKKYHQYQTHCTFGFEMVQNSLIQSYCLKAFEEKSSESFPIIEALLQENIPIKVIQAMILCQSAFNPDKSLEIYNKYIQQVSKTPNEYTNRSPAGLLNESIVLAYLYNNDRDFANVIFDKIAGSNLLQEHEVAAIKKLFKVYGDAFIDDDWELAKPRLDQFVSSSIKNL